MKSHQKDMYVRVKKDIVKITWIHVALCGQKKRRKVTTRTQYDLTDLNKDSKPRPHFSYDRKSGAYKLILPIWIINMSYLYQLRFAIYYNFY